MAETRRADGRHNYELLLDAARTAFAEYGTEVSLRDVARRAGVGIGTLYRHFPTREALVEAIVRRGLDGLCVRADELMESEPPGEALNIWLVAFSANSSRYAGLPGSILAAVDDETSELHHSCHAMRTKAAQLLARAQQAGEARGDVTAGELLLLATGVAWAGQQTSNSADMTVRLLGLVRTGIDGT